jgi:hypothetical protein
MYRTIEADIEDGRIVGPESRRIPRLAHALITLLPRKDAPKRVDFTSLAGRLRWSGDTVAEQRKMRDEW